MRHTIVLIAFLLASLTTHCQTPYVDSLLQIVSLHKGDEAEMKALFSLALNCYRANTNKAKTYLFQQLQLAVPADNFYRQSGGYALLLSLYQEEGLMDSATWCVNKLRGVAEMAPNDKKTQLNYNQAMGLYHRKKGEHKIALPYALAAAKYAEQSDVSKADAGGQWLNAGNVYVFLGDYNNSMACHLKALRLFEEAGNRLGESFCYNSIATAYYKLKQYPKGLEYAEKSLALKKSINDKRGVCVSEMMIGEIYMSMGNAPAALKKFEIVLKLSLEEKMLTEEADCYFNMAKIFKEQKKDSLAIIHFKKSKELALQINRKELVADTDAELATLYKNADNIRHTETTLVASLNAFKESGNLNDEANNYKRLSDFYVSTKQYDKALDNLNKYHAVKDSIGGLEVQVQMKKLEEQYNTAKKQQEIEILKKDKQLQEQKLSRQKVLMAGAGVLALLAIAGVWLLINRNRLKQRMKELELRNQIAADLHDEVGSSLSSIHMLSQMAAQPGTEASRKDDILQRMSSNAKETMEKMSDLVWTIKPEEAEGSNLKQRMERFSYEICGAKNIDLTLELDKLDEKDLTMEQRKTMYLIFKEALNNAVKYSGTDKVYVSASNGSNMLTMIVKDEGKGFDSTVVQKGNGLNNILNRAAGIGGKLDIDSAPGKGTLVKLVMPLKI